MPVGLHKASLRVYLSIHPGGKSSSDLGRVLDVLNDPRTRDAATLDIMARMESMPPEILQALKNAKTPGGGVITNKHSTDVEYSPPPPPPLRVCMRKTLDRR